MSRFSVSEMRPSTIWTLYRVRENIQLDPDYQRQGDIWDADKRATLLDSILNRFDIPKIYLHKFSSPKKIKGKDYTYAVIDGRQRLETIWAFIDGKIALADEFAYFDDSSVEAGNMTYGELGKEYPLLKADFDGFPLNVVCIETDDIELIEEMFSRLNEGVPLTAAEKRQTFGGPLPRAIRDLAKHRFFKSNLPFGNSRYRHFDVAVKFLLAEHRRRVVDTKKRYLDDFVRHWKDSDRSDKLPFEPQSKKTLDAMAAVFTHKDPLLRSVGMVTTYYHLFRVAREQRWIRRITRSKLMAFEELRAKNREMAERSLRKARFDLLEFDRYAQSPNDEYAIKLRLQVLLRHAFDEKVKIDAI